MNTPIRLRSLALATWILFPALGWSLAYKGAEIYSTESMIYGKWEMRMMAAKGSGTLSTFFLYKDGSEKGLFGWEEIDIEIKGKDNAANWQSNLITGINGATKSEDIHGPGDFGEQFHTYTVEWTPGKVVWKVDGATIRTSEGGQANEIDSAMGYRFNIWSSTSTAWVGAFDPAILPIYQYVNWLTYSSYTPGTGPGGSDFTPQWSDEFDTFNDTRWRTATWTFPGNRVDFDPANIVVKDGMLVLALTREGETGFTGSVPTDAGGNSPIQLQTQSVQPSTLPPHIVIQDHRPILQHQNQFYSIAGRREE